MNVAGASNLREHPPRATLYALGNPIESVARFLGHRNTQVTAEVYTAMSGAQRRQMLDIPWLRDRPEQGALREEAEALACALCSPFASADGRTFPRLVFGPTRSHPNAEAVRRCLRDTADLVYNEDAS